MMTGTVYGPYTRADGRKHVVIVSVSGHRRTQSYPRYLMEQILGRELSDSETVDHIDGDFTNDNPKNLQLLSRSDNTIRSHAVGIGYKFNCPQCGREFTRNARNYRHNQISQRKAGPFCSHHCSGLYGLSIKNASMAK